MGSCTVEGGVGSCTVEGGVGSCTVEGGVGPVKGSWGSVQLGVGA